MVVGRRVLALPAVGLVALLAVGLVARDGARGRASAAHAVRDEARRRASSGRGWVRHRGKTNKQTKKKAASDASRGRAGTSVLGAFLFVEDAGGSGGPAGLKLAASGSTWWYDELTAQKGIHLEQELFTSSSHQGPRAREDKMVDRLGWCVLVPRARPGDARRQVPRRRRLRLHDLAEELAGRRLGPRRPRRGLRRRLGAQQPGQDRRVHRARPRRGAAARRSPPPRPRRRPPPPRSQVRKRVLRVCGGKPNIHPGSKKADCANATAVFRVDDVEALLIEQLEWRVDFEAAVAAARARPGSCFLRMRYEDFQRNETAELRRLFRDALGLGEPRRKDGKRLATMKKTSEDLRDVIANYAEVEAYVATVDTPACPLAAMLHSTSSGEAFDCDLDAALAAAKRARKAAGRAAHRDNDMMHRDQEAAQTNETRARALAPDHGR